MSNQIRSSYQIHQTQNHHMNHNQSQPIQFNHVNHKKWWDDISKNNHTYNQPNGLNSNITYNTSPMNISSFTTNRQQNLQPNIQQSLTSNIQNGQRPVMQRISQLPEPIQNPVHSNLQAPSYKNNVTYSKPPIYQPPIYKSPYIHNAQSNSNNTTAITPTTFLPLQNYPTLNTSPLISPLSQNYLNQVRQTPTQGCGCGK